MDQKSLYFIHYSKLILKPTFLVFLFVLIGSVIVVFKVNVGVPDISCIFGSCFFPIGSTVEVKLADIFFDLDHFFIKFSFSCSSLDIKSDGHEISFHFYFFNVEVGHIAIFAGLKILPFILFIFFVSAIHEQLNN